MKILGHWEIGYHAPITEQYYWTLVIRDFGHDDWNMIPKSGIKNLERQVNLTEWDTYRDFFKAHPNLKRVFLEPNHKGAVWLHEYSHPEDCVYIFGSAHYNPTIANKREGDDVITIKTKMDTGVPWASQILAILLYDREVKSWQ